MMLVPPRPPAVSYRTFCPKRPGKESPLSHQITKAASPEKRTLLKEPQFLSFLLPVINSHPPAPPPSQRRFPTFTFAAVPVFGHAAATFLRRCDLTFRLAGEVEAPASSVTIPIFLSPALPLVLALAGLVEFLLAT
jgi:hypothetical protein